MDIEKRIKELEREQKTIELNFHRVSGAIAILKELLANEPTGDKPIS